MQYIYDKVDETNRESEKYGKNTGNIPTDPCNIHRPVNLMAENKYSSSF